MIFPVIAPPQQMYPDNVPESRARRRAASRVITGGAPALYRITGQAIGLYDQALAIARDTGDRRREGILLGDPGHCHLSLGEYRQAIDMYTQAPAIARDTGDRRSEGATLSGLGHCHLSLGEYRDAIDLCTQTLAIARQIGDRYGEAIALGYLGRAWLASGDARRAVMLLGQAVSIADIIGTIEPATRARSGLARAYLQLGDPAAALAATSTKRELSYPAEEPTMRVLEGLALLELRRPEEGVRAFGEAVVAADALLALADRNVAALQAWALALSGLAAATGDLARAAEADSAFARAYAVTDAAGVTVDIRRLLGQIARHDRAGILAGVHAALRNPDLPHTSLLGTGARWRDNAA
jgi:tetratricopeptide (TPR) repeat protein